MISVVKARILKCVKNKFAATSAKTETKQMEFFQDLPSFWLHGHSNLDLKMNLKMISMESKGGHVMIKHQCRNTKLKVECCMILSLSLKAVAIQISKFHNGVALV